LPPDNVTYDCYTVAELQTYRYVELDTDTHTSSDNKLCTDDNSVIDIENNIVNKIVTYTMTAELSCDL